MSAEIHDAGRAPEQRLDKWLWHARFVRTRTAAARLIEDGHVRVNAKRAETAARCVRPGDVLTLALGRDIRVVRARAIAPRRGPASLARQLYDDLTDAGVCETAGPVRLAPPGQSG